MPSLALNLMSVWKVDWMDGQGIQLKNEEAKSEGRNNLYTLD